MEMYALKRVALNAAIACVAAPIIAAYFVLALVWLVFYFDMFTLSFVVIEPNYNIKLMPEYR